MRALGRGSRARLLLRFLGFREEKGKKKVGCRDGWVSVDPKRGGSGEARGPTSVVTRSGKSLRVPGGEEGVAQVSELSRSDRNQIWRASKRFFFFLFSFSSPQIFVGKVYGNRSGSKGREGERREETCLLVNMDPLASMTAREVKFSEAMSSSPLNCLYV